MKECMIWTMATSTARPIRTISVVVLLVTIFFWAFFDISKKAAILAVVNPFAEDPYDAVGSFGVQLAFAAALLSILRAFRPYRSRDILSKQRLLILRGETVALLSIVVTLAADIVAMLRYPSMWRDSPGGWILLGLMGVVIFLMAMTGLWLYRFATNYPVPSANRSWVRLIILVMSLLVLAIYPEAVQDSIPGGILSALLGMVLLFLCTWALATVILPTAEKNFEDLLDDIASIYRAAKSRVRIISVFENLAKIWWLRSFVDWLNPRQHKWNFIVVTALAMGVVLLLAETIHEGVSTSTNVVLLVITVFVGIEGLGVFFGYLLFGEFLEIFRKE